MGRKVLIVAAHPDDEVLGCGGTVARHVMRGDSVDILIIAEGATSRDSGGGTRSPDDEVVALVAAANKAAKTLGTQQPIFGGLTDNRLDTVALLDVIKFIENVGAEIQPDIVYTHHAGDLNIDHQVVARATVTAFRPLPDSSVRAIYSFETVSSTEWAVLSAESAFQPSHFEDISDVLDLKRAAMECYATELREFPHPRSIIAIEALAQVRGAAVGLSAAEAFCVIREIVV